jgi:Aminoglycoside-2''-adenylyltransferase
MSTSDLARRQFDLIVKVAALEPAPRFMGGYAEDAILAGSVTRAHEDVDLIFPRDQQELRLAELADGN